MNQRRARLFYRLSLLMILMSFLAFVVLIASLFILNLQGAFNCDTPTALGACTIRDRFQGYKILITGSATLIVVFIILASYFQQFFLVKKPKEKKQPPTKKVKAMFSKDQNLAVFEVEPKVTPAEPVVAGPPQKAPKRKNKKVKPSLAEYTISHDLQDDSLEAIKQSVFTQPDTPLKLPKDLKELADDDSDYLENQDDSKDKLLTKDAKDTASDKAKDASSPAQSKSHHDDSETAHKKDDSVDQTKVKVLAQDKTDNKKTTSPKPKTKHESIDQAVKRKRRTQAHTKEDISLIVAKRVNLDNDQARQIIDITFDIIKDALTDHDKVNILKFGTFSTKQLKARTMQVPSKEEAETTIPAHHVVRFKSSPAFDSFVNEDDSEPPIDFEPVTATPKDNPPTTHIENDTLIEGVSNQTGLSIAEVKTFMTSFMTTAQDTLAAKDSLTLTNFGTFETIYHKEKKMIVPATKETKIIPGYYTVKFRPSKAFTEFLNEN